MSDEVKLPTEDEIAQLPRWARVAFAARCARRALPLFTKHWPSAPVKHIDAVTRAVTFAEQTASDATSSDDSVTEIADATNAIADETTTTAAAAVVAAATDAAFAAFANAAHADAANVAARVAHAGVSVTLIRADYQRLWEESRRLEWTDDSPVPSSVFEPLYFGTKSLVVELFANANVQPSLMGEAVVKLWEAANEYHMARGGGVLTFDEFKQVIPALDSVGPTAEG